MKWYLQDIPAPTVFAVIHGRMTPLAMLTPAGVSHGLLVMAAPDLRDALKGLMDLDGSETEAVQAAAWEAARKALAKAGTP